MRLDETVTRSTIPSPVNQTGETGMMQRERWEEVRRLFYQERMRIREQLQVFHRGELVASHPVQCPPALFHCAGEPARETPRAPRRKCAIWPSMISSPVAVPWR